MDEINFKCEQRNLFVEVPCAKKKNMENIEKNIVPIKSDENVHVLQILFRFTGLTLMLSMMGKMLTFQEFYIVTNERHQASESFLGSLIKFSSFVVLNTKNFELY